MSAVTSTDLEVASAASTADTLAGSDRLALPHADARERRLALLETALVLAAFHAYVYFGRPSLGVDYVVLGGLTLAVFAAFRRRGETARTIAYLGDLRGAARLAGPAALLTILGASAIRLAVGGSIGPRDGPVFPGVLVACAVYPIWGFAQQLFYVGFAWRGLIRGGLPPLAATLVSGVLFGVIHAPNWPLVLATLPLGLFCAWCYRRAPSVLVLGILHGIGGALAMKVLGLDLEIGAGFLRPH
jgi:membrane protease YdiL (CAAX protease family)